MNTHQKEDERRETDKEDICVGSRRNKREGGKPRKKWMDGLNRALGYWGPTHSGA